MEPGMKVKQISIFVLGAAVIATACGRFSATSKDKSKVVVDLTCTNGGISAYKVDPYTAAITHRTQHFTWTLSSGSTAVEAIISAKGTNPWPFDDPYYTVTTGNSVKSKTVKADIPEGTYKYLISAVCSLPDNKQDTVPIDPDMIIPKGDLK
jgi:hypothetical protein